MLKFLTNPPSPLLGMEITAFAVKILEISETKGQPSVERYGSVFLAPNLLDGQEIKEVDAVAHSIKKLHQSCQFTSKHVALAVPDSSVITQRVSLPKDISEEEMETLLMLEADKFIPYPLSEIHWDFAVQGLSANKPNHCDVLMVASRSEAILNRLECLHRAGLTVQVIDVESFAVERIAQRLIQSFSMQSKAVAILYVGIYTIHLFVFQNQELIFYREEKMGENQYLQAFAESSHASLNDVKPIPFDAYDPTILELFKQSLLLQIQRFFQLYYSSGPDELIEFLFLAGELANISGLKARIQEQLNLSCQVINPFSKMSIHPRVDLQALNQGAPSLLVACGLALHRHGSH